MNYSFTIAALLFSYGAQACSGFLPDNNLSLPISDKDEGMSREQFDTTINKVATIYRPIISQYGGKLKINRDWESPVVNAGTLRKENEWRINLHGGLARHKEMTEDAYALVICHEIGHHIGGAPKKIINDRKHWASTEGQSDYWATLKCLRRVFEKEDNQVAITAMKIPEAVKKSCKTVMCKRIALASHAVSKINAQIRELPHPQFETHDGSVVERTYNYHPVAQCRLDTLFHGTLCKLDWRSKVSQLYEGPGTCHPKEGFSKGIRPLCWYKSTR